MSSIEYLKGLFVNPRTLGDFSGGPKVRFDLYSEAIDSMPLQNAVGDCFGEVFEEIRDSMIEAKPHVRHAE